MALNKEQFAAATSKEPVQVVIAGPGSGKTHTLIESVNLKVQAGMKPASIVILTFTNAGGSEVKKRLGDMKVGFVGTRHAFCLRLLQSYGSAIGYRNGAISLIKPEDYLAMLIQEAKIQGRKVSEKAIKEKRLETVAIYKTVAIKLKRANVIDYDQIIKSALALLQIASIRDQLAENIKFYCVDEAQDNSPDDWLVDFAVPAEMKLIVGDVDQSCYGFRAAQPEGLVDAAARFGAIYLTVNYRSGAAICEAANRLIAHNKLRVPKLTIPADDREGIVGYQVYGDEREEAMEIATELQEQYGNDLPYSEMAVLTRTNAQAALIASELRLRGIPIAETTQGAMPRDWSDCLDFINLFINPNDDICAERMARKHGATEAEIQGYKSKALESGGSMASVGALAGFKGLFEESLGTVDPVPNFLCELGISQDSIQIVRQRIEILPSSRLGDLLSDLWRTETWSVKAAVIGVTVSTVHNSKGKEWPFVIVARLNEGDFPKLTRTTDMEEERRLAFVAFTRAKERLLLSSTLNRKPHDFAQPGPCDQSRFVFECQAETPA